MSFPTKETLLSFIRGGNLGDANCTDGSTGTACTTWSTWPHAAVEHSKPVIVNYDISTTPPVQYMYYVQNNGMLTAVDTNTGQEKWSFLVEEALPKLQLLQANANGPETYVADGSPVVFYDDLNGDGFIDSSAGDRVWLYFGLRRGGRAYYALDITQKDTPFFKWKITADQPSLIGSITSGQNRIDVGWSASFAVGMTVKVTGAGASGADLTATITAINGGQNQITLSANASTTVAGARVDTVGTPLSAKVCNASSTCGAVASYSELGQAWSTPNIVKLKALFGAPNNPPALIFGGGYDPAEDTVPPGARTMGRAVFVVNGDNASTNDGTLKSYGAGQGDVAGNYRTANMLTTYAVASDVTAINTDFDANNYVDRLIVGDLGGNVWRFDVDDPVSGAWRGLRLADLSNAAGEKRKFFFPPAVAPQDHPFSFHAVYIGSGDKEHPLLTGSTTPATTDDRMFMLMDDPRLTSGGGTPDVGGPSALTTPITLATLVDIADVSTTGADANSLTSTANSLTGRQGWSRRLDNGEKVINAPTVFRLQAQISRLRFGTYAPLTQLNACTPPGEGRLNEIDSLSGDLLAINGAAAGAQRWYTAFLSRGYMSSTQLLILPSGGAGSTKIIYQFNCADANCQGSQIGQLGAPTKIYWYLEPEQ
jgi:Tfp pilus tip-associated adhesin PilY1